MTLPDLEPADLDDPDLDDAMRRHDEQVAALLCRREDLARRYRHAIDDDAYDLAAELEMVDEELAALGAAD